MVFGAKFGLRAGFLDVEVEADHGFLESAESFFSLTDDLTQPRQQILTNAKLLPLETQTYVSDFEDLAALRE